MGTERYQRCALIYNPTSGRRQILREKKVEWARETLQQWIPRVDKMATESMGDAVRLTREAIAGGYDLIAACGGDGTLNEVVGGIGDSGVTLLPLPAGTANLLAKQASIPMEPDKAAALFPEAAPYEVPLGIVRCENPQPSERLFLLLCGVGVDASIIYSLNTKLKAYLGQGAYWLGSLDHLHRKFDPFRIRIDGETHECTFALLSKSRVYAGHLAITPDAHPFRDEFDVVLFHGQSPLRYVNYLAQIAARKLDQLPDVTFHRASRAELFPLDSDRVYVQVDGELAGRLPATVEVAAHGVKVLLPARYADEHARPVTADALSSAAV